ncbi:hypothetical protein EKO04_009022 [Ascochyta lentis]|uniref:Uncharacterized protein n=1 Tax=Ascochyta lentis TaxID=205686 RepID=A0A8H7IVC3_9PLEO|nr:hypothetical protein EKO04_009022 [Ascochyta lentis]
MAQLSFDQTDLNHIFLCAFKDCATSIIDGLSTDANDPATTIAIQTIVEQINYDHNRFAYVLDIIQARIYRDSLWAGAAVAVLDLIATFIDPAFVHPVLQIRGPSLVQYQLMRVLQARFTEMMMADVWSHGFILFIGQLGAARDSIGSLTPGIALHILTSMIDSRHLFSGQNLDMLFDFVIAVGPFLDNQTWDIVDGFGGKLQVLQERVKCEGTTTEKVMPLPYCLGVHTPIIEDTCTNCSPLCSCSLTNLPHFRLIDINGMTSTETKLDVFKLGTAQLFASLPDAIDDQNAYHKIQYALIGIG